ncbi:MAG: PIN-like domain-containing protein [Longimicrobiaceae bacterium]
MARTPLVTEYPHRSEEELHKLWIEAAFVFDANVLLNVYRYSPSTTEELLDVLASVGDRLWLPHQAAIEYERNRETVVGALRKPFANAKAAIDKIPVGLEEALSKYTDRDRLLESLKVSLSQAKDALEAAVSSFETAVPADSLHESLLALFKGKVGVPFTIQRKLEIYDLGVRRFQYQIPPGYSDVSNKPEPERYGDLLLWFQILDFAQDGNRPIILVTDDRKDDWFAGPRGRRTGPRPELILEMLEVTNRNLYIYEVDNFLKNARAHLRIDISDQAINEARDVGYELNFQAALKSLSDRNVERQPLRGLNAEELLVFVESADKFQIIGPTMGFRDETGSRWRAYEMNMYQGETLVGTALFFGRPGEERVLAEYPADYYRLKHRTFRRLLSESVLRYKSQMGERGLVSGSSA